MAGGGALLLYALTVHPGLVGGDAGELAAAACAGGVAHPPGYPLHGLLLRLVAFGDVLLHFNLVSAVGGALTVGLLCETVTRWTGRAEAGLFSAAAWLASPLPWRYATTLEVFSLHTALLAAVALALTVDVSRGGTRRSAFVLGLLSALAVTHHQTALFLVLPAVGLRAWRHPSMTALTLGGLAGCAPLLLLPLWSGTATAFSWGELRTFDGLITHLLRREYGTFQLAAGEGRGGLFDFLSAFAHFEWRQLGGAAALLAIAGAFTVTRDVRRWLGVALVSLVLCLFVFGALANLPLDNPLLRAVVERFFLMPHLLLCAGAGLAVLRSKGVSSRAVLVAAGLLVAVGIARHPRHDDTTVRSYGEAVLAQPPGALVLTQGDLISNTAHALQACEGLRAELPVVDQQLLTYRWYVERLRHARPDLNFPGERWHPTEAGAFTLTHFLQANPGRPLILCGGLKAGDALPLRRVPWGLCERVLREGEAFDEAQWFEQSAAALPPLDRTSATAEPGSWEEVVRRDAWHARAQRGLHALEVGMAQGDDVTWLRRAYDILVECTVKDEAPQAAVFKNLGIAAGRLGRTEEMKAAFRRYLEVGPKGDPQREALRALVQQ